MPRARNPERDKAREIWEASGRSIKLCDIAKELAVPEATVRAWKSKDKWEAPSKKNVGNAPNAKRNAPKRKSGGQPGNKNAKGAPPGNARAATHGAYMKFYESVLSDEEMEAYQYLIDQDERQRLRTLYAQHQMTERRLMEEIAAIRNGAEMIIHRTVSHIEPSGKKAADGREITKVVKISQEQETRKEQLRNFTDALTRVRAEMRRVADSLRQLTEVEAKQLVNESTQSLVEAMAEAFERRGGDDTDD